MLCLVSLSFFLQRGEITITNLPILNMEILLSGKEENYRFEFSWTSSVPKKDVCPISHIISCAIEIATVVKASSPVDRLTIEILLVVRWLQPSSTRR